MSEVLLFHHAHGLTAGILAFGNKLREHGHKVYIPDLYDGRMFDELEAGIAYAREIGFDAIIQRGVQAADGLPDHLVYAGFSLGVYPPRSSPKPGPALPERCCFMRASLPPSLAAGRRAFLFRSTAWTPTRSS
jgi:hypothetical protein